MRLIGSIDDLNIILQHISYKVSDATHNGVGTPNYKDLNDTVFVTFKINDLNNGEEPANDAAHTADHQNALETVRHMRIHVSPINSAPTEAGNGKPLTVWEDEPAQIFGTSPTGDLPYLKFADPDAFDKTTNTITISVKAGQLQYNGALKPVYSTTADGHTLTLTGSLSVLNAALSKITYIPPENQSGSTTIMVTYNDNGNTGGGNDPLQTAPYIINVLVKPVNDSPEAAINGADRTQTIGGQDYPTFEIKSGSNPKDSAGNYLIDLNGKITISDPGDALNKTGFDGQTGVDPGASTDFSVTLKPTDFSDSSKVLGEFRPRVEADWAAFKISHPGVSISIDDGALTITGSMGNVQTALDALVYVMPKGIAEGNSAPTVQVSVTVNDCYNGYDPADRDSAQTKHSPQDIPTFETNFLVNVNVTNRAPIITSDKPEIAINEDSPAINLNNSFKNNDPQSKGLHVEDKDAFLDEVLYKIELVYINESGVEVTLPTSLGQLYKGNNAVGGNAITDGYALKGASNYQSTGLSIEALNALIDTLRFKPADDWNGVVHLRITVNDKGHTGDFDANHTNYHNGGLETIRDFKITVNPVNDAPTVNGGKTVNMTPGVTEDSKNHAGETLESLLGTKFQDEKDARHDQPDPGDKQGGTFVGVFVVGNTSTVEGSWEYFDKGQWNPIPSDVGEDQAFYLSKGTEIRFVPAKDYHGTPPPLTVRLVEDTPITAPYADQATYDSIYGASLINGARRDLRDNSGSDAVAPAYRPYTIGPDGKIDIKVTVTNVNDAPLWTAAEIPKITVAEDAANHPGHKVSELFGNNWDDSADNSAGGNLGGLGGLLITDIKTDTSKGNWQYSTDGVGWTDITFNGGSEAFFLQADHWLRFKPAENFHCGAGDYLDGLTVYLADNHGTVPGTGQIGQPIASEFGDTGRYSAEGKTLQVIVTPVNDAPVRQGPAEVTVDTRIHSGHNTEHLESWKVEYLATGQYGDPNDTEQPNGLDSFQGILITEATTATGTWQYLDAGNIWRDFRTGLSSANPLYLDKGTEVRFKGKVGQNSGDAHIKCLLVENDLNSDDPNTAPVFTNGQKVDLGTYSTGGSTRISDESDPWKVSVNFDAGINDPPTITIGGPLTVKEDTSRTLSGIRVEDKDHNDVLTVTLTTANGQVVGGSSANYNLGETITGSNGATLTLKGNLAVQSTADGQGVILKGLSEDINAYINTLDNLTYSGAPDFNGADQVNITVADSTGQQVTDKLTITVSPVNDAPVILNPDEAVIKEVPANFGPGYQPEIWTVADLFQNKFSDPKDSGRANGADGFQGILITDSSLMTGEAGFDGTWYYKNQGGEWTEFSISPGGAPLYLNAEAEIKFEARDNTPGQAGLKFLVVEDNGENGAAADAPSGSEFDNPGSGQNYDIPTAANTGGSTRISAEDSPGQLLVNISDKKVKDPEITVTEPISLPEDGSIALSLDNLKLNDEDYHDQLTVTLSAGQGRVSADPEAGLPADLDGFSFESVGNSLVLKGTWDQINEFIDNGGVRYSPESDYYGPDRISVTVVDSGANTSSDHLTVTVTPVNDAPVTVGQEPARLLSVTNDQTPPGQTVGRLFEGRLDDSRDQPGYEGQLTGILVQGDASDPSQGRWEYSTDGGRSWQALPPVSPGQALYLEAGDALRFVPQSGFTGEPGPLTVHLVESLPDQRPYAVGDWPTFISGGAYDLSSDRGPNAVAPDFRGYTQATLELRTSIQSGRTIDHISNQTNNSTNSDIRPQDEPAEIKHSGDDGLDSPQFRTAQGGAIATDTIITDTHIGSVIQNGNRILTESVSQGLAQIATQNQGGGSPASDPTADSEAAADNRHQWFLGSIGLPEHEDGLRHLDLAGLGLAPADDLDLRYEARMADGSQLPEWIEFDPAGLTITVKDCRRLEEECLVNIIALENRGDRIALEVRLKPEKLVAADESPSETEGQPEDAEEVEKALDRAEESLNEAAASFRDLWFSQTQAPADNPEAPAGDTDLDQKVAQLPCTMGALQRAAEDLLLALRS